MHHFWLIYDCHIERNYSMHVFDTTEKSLEKLFYQSLVQWEKNMKKCKIYTVPGSSHTGFFGL